MKMLSLKHSIIVLFLSILINFQIANAASFNENLKEVRSEINRDNLDEAIKKMQRALDEYIIEGVKTTIPFHQRLMRHPRFKSGDFTTKFMEEETV